MIPADLINHDTRLSETKVHHLPNSLLLHHSEPKGALWALLVLHVQTRIPKILVFVLQDLRRHQIRTRFSARPTREDDAVHSVDC
jgi:hypothetical protein